MIPAHIIVRRTSYALDKEGAHVSNQQERPDEQVCNVAAKMTEMRKHIAAVPAGTPAKNLKELRLKHSTTDLPYQT